MNRAARRKLEKTQNTNKSKKGVCKVSMRNENQLRETQAIPEGGIATIDDDFQINSFDDALYFSYLIDEWFIQNGPICEFRWQVLLKNGEIYSWVLKESTGEEYLDKRFDRVTGTFKDLILAEISEDRNVYCKAETGNYEFLASQLFNLKNVTNSGIVRGAFDEVRVYLTKKNFQNVRDENLKSRIRKIVRQGDIERILACLD